MERAVAKYLDTLGELMALSIFYIFLHAPSNYEVYSSRTISTNFTQLKHALSMVTVMPSPTAVTQFYEYCECISPTRPHLTHSSL